MAAIAETRPWWDEYTLGAGETQCWTFGQLQLAVCRLPDEWRIAWRHTAADDEASQWSVEPHPQGLEGWPQLERFACRRTAESLRLAPRLADRPVVVRPVSPFNLPSGESVMLFVSTPVWVAVETGVSGGDLLEVPITRPSDTWFGADTQSGELCYASQTHARLRLEDVPLRVHRAITPLRITNDAPRSLRLERLSLPVPYLSLFADPAANLWTQDVAVRHEGDARAASLTLGGEPPSTVEGAVPVGQPRQVSEEPVLRRALSALLG